jgi:hypothetical protein
MANELGFYPCDCAGTCRVFKSKKGLAFSFCDRCGSQHLTRNAPASDALLARMTHNTNPQEPTMPTPKPKGATDEEKNKGGDRRQETERRKTGAGTRDGSTRRAKEESPQESEHDAFGAEIFGEGKRQPPPDSD